MIGMPMIRVALVALLLLTSPALAGEQAVTIPVRGEVTESFYLTLPTAAPPKAILILFPGGGGAIDVREPVPPPEKAGNFLARSRALLAERGFVVATLDAPSDSADGMPEPFRVSATHAEDVAKVAAWLRERHSLPVWLVGTSRGTLSAANAALRLGDGIDGLVLTSSVTRTSKQGPHSLLNMDLDRITVPTLGRHCTVRVAGVVVGGEQLARHPDHAAGTEGDAQLVVALVPPVAVDAGDHQDAGEGGLQPPAHADQGPPDAGAGQCLGPAGEVEVGDGRGQAQEAGGQQHRVEGLPIAFQNGRDDGLDQLQTMGIAGNGLASLAAHAHGRDASRQGRSRHG